MRESFRATGAEGGFSLLDVRLEACRFDAGEHLAALHGVAFPHLHVGDPPRDVGADVDEALGSDLTRRRDRCGQVSPTHFLGPDIDAHAPVLDDIEGDDAADDGHGGDSDDDPGAFDSHTSPVV